MRLAALTLAAAALAAPLAGSASAVTSCTDVTTYTAVCVTYGCRDHRCIVKDYNSVYTTCDHPMPPRTCVTFYLPEAD